VSRMNQSELERQAAAPAGGGGRDSGLTNPGADLSSADQQSQEPADMSTIPDKSVVYHGEGMFSKGHQGGVEVSKNCPFQVKVPVEPKHMMFQMMRRWIMDAFKVDKATHDITLRYLVCVKNTRLPRRHYYMLVDIPGDDAWATFVDMTSRFGGSFALYAQWHAKATAPDLVPDGASTSNSGAATRPAAAMAAAPKEPAVMHGHGESWPLCKHGKLCSIETTWGNLDPGRRFYRCRLSPAGKDCGFTKWLDDKFPEKATKHINSLLSSVECLEQEVENLQEEIDEFRHRYVISSHCAPRDTQSGGPRPRQVRRLVRHK